MDSPGDRGQRGRSMEGETINLPRDILNELHEIEARAAALVLPFYKPYGLTLLQTRALVEIARSEPTAVCSLAARLGMAAPNASILAKRLAQDGFVRRGRAAGDERRVEITLTPRGRDVLRAAGDAVSAHYAPMLAQVPAQEQRELLRGLAQLRDLLGRLTPPGFEETRT